MKVQQSIALKKEDQVKYTKKTRQLKKKIKTGEITVKEKKKAKKVLDDAKRGLVYVGHLPHGFFEEEMRNYFKQFGAVTNIKVCRSSKTGNSKGYGYVEFLLADVAKIAAETMNNYLMFKRRITAEYVPLEKRPKNIFCGKSATPTSFPTQRRRLRYFNSKNEKIDDDEHLEKSKSRLTRLQKKIQKLKELDIECNVKPVDAPKSLKSVK